jgi:MFS family permease
MAGVEVTTIIAAVNVIATYFAFRWIDKLGRRKLSMGGYAGMAVAAVVAGIGLLALTGMAEIVVVMIALNAFIASFAIGVGGTGWLLQGEVFPTAVRGQAAAIRRERGLGRQLRGSSRCSRSGRAASAWAGS